MDADNSNIGSKLGPLLGSLSSPTKGKWSPSARPLQCVTFLHDNFAKV